MKKVYLIKKFQNLFILLKNPISQRKVEFSCWVAIVTMASSPATIEAATAPSTVSRIWRAGIWGTASQTSMARAVKPPMRRL